MVDVICPPLSISSIVVSLWLAGCLAKNTLIGWREYYGGGGVGVDTCVEPSKREDLTQCCFNIAPPPTALDQHWNNIGSSLRVCWESCPHFDTRVSSVSGRNRQHSALCNAVYGYLIALRWLIWASRSTHRSANRQRNPCDTRVIPAWKSQVSNVIKISWFSFHTRVMLLIHGQICVLITLQPRMW